MTKHHRFVRIGDIFSVTCYVPGTLCILSHLACRFLVFHTMRADNFGLADLMKSCLHKVLQTCCQPSVIVYVLTCGLLNRMFLSPSGLWLVFTVAFKFYWLTQNVNLLNVRWIIEQTGKRLLQDEVAPGNDETAAEMWKSNQQDTSPTWRVGEARLIMPAVPEELAFWRSGSQAQMQVCFIGLRWHGPIG